MKNYTLPMIAAACLVFLAVGTTGVFSRAESAAVRENLEKLKKTNACRGCDLSGLTLTRMNLPGADLEGADLSRTKVSLSNLSGANLRNANLKGASFGGTDLGEADLRGADLRGASLEGAYLEQARIDGEFVTARPYEDVGVNDVEKQVYVPNPEKPKQSPKTGEVKITTPHNPGVVPVEDSVVRQKGTSSVAKESVDTARTATEGKKPDMPPVKKVIPVRQAIVEPNDLAAQNMEGGDARPEPSGIEEKRAIGKDQEMAFTKVPKTQGKYGKPSPKPPNAVSIDDVVLNGIAEGVMNGSKKENSAPPPMDVGKKKNLARLLNEDSCYACDLSGLDLSGKNLNHVDLEQANLAGCNLERVNLENANLKGAILQDAILRMASLKNADLYKADLSGADLSGADVQGAKLDNANISETIGLSGKGL